MVEMWGKLGGIYIYIHTHIYIYTHIYTHTYKNTSTYCCVESCPTLLWHHGLYSPAGSSVHGFSRQEYWSGVPLPSLGNFSSASKLCILETLFCPLSELLYRGGGTDGKKALTSPPKGERVWPYTKQHAFGLSFHFDKEVMIFRSDI